MNKDLGLKFFASVGKPIFFKKGEIILRPDENPSGIFYIKKGLVRLYTLSASGQEITHNIYKPGSYLFMMWALSENDNNYFFETLTDTETIKAPKETVIEFIKGQPQVLFELNQRTMTGLESLIATTQMILLGNADSKIAAVFLMLSRRFGKNGTNSHITIMAPLTHRLIATLAGLSRERASVEIKKLETEKIISRKKQYYIVNKMHALESKSEADTSNSAVMP